jgi:hypothetical protein
MKLTKGKISKAYNKKKQTMKKYKIKNTHPKNASKKSKTFRKKRTTNLLKTTLKNYGLLGGAEGDKYVLIEGRDDYGNADNYTIAAEGITPTHVEVASGQIVPIAAPTAEIANAEVAPAEVTTEVPVVTEKYVLKEGVISEEPYDENNYILAGEGVTPTHEKNANGIIVPIAAPTAEVDPLDPALEVSTEVPVVTEKYVLKEGFTSEEPYDENNYTIAGEGITPTHEKNAEGIIVPIPATPAEVDPLGSDSSEEQEEQDFNNPVLHPKQGEEGDFDKDESQYDNPDASSQNAMQNLNALSKSSNPEVTKVYDALTVIVGFLQNIHRDVTDGNGTIEGAARIQSDSSLSNPQTSEGPGQSPSQGQGLEQGDDAVFDQANQELGGQELGEEGEEGEGEEE